MAGAAAAVAMAVVPAAAANAQNYGGSSETTSPSVASSSTEQTTTTTAPTTTTDDVEVAGEVVTRPETQVGGNVLARTGGEILQGVVIGGALVGVGAVFVAGTRRRRAAA